jgi:hypothetical protein
MNSEQAMLRCDAWKVCTRARGCPHSVPHNPTIYLVMQRLSGEGSHRDMNCEGTCSIRANGTHDNRYKGLCKEVI